MNVIKFRLMTGAALVAVALFAAAPAHALSIGFSGALNSATIVYEGAVNYPNVGFTGNGTVISKDQGSLTGILSASYLASDFDFSSGGTSGFRWTEMITNNTGQAWTNYSLELSPGWFFVAPPDAPNFVTVTPGAPYVVSPNFAFGSLVVNGPQTRIDFTFAAPLASGSSFSIHTPVHGLASAAPGALAIVETATAAAPAVPEPASLLLLGTGLAGLRAWRKRRS